jgi:hypothetical protein
MSIPKYFNTSGPNILSQHYTLPRTALVQKGKKMVEGSRYFTIWAPRQSGKSTYFRMLATELEKEGYKVSYLNCKNYNTLPLEEFTNYLNCHLWEQWEEDFQNRSFLEIFEKIESNKKDRYVLVIDEIEDINQEYLGLLLHSIRRVFHSRETHALKSVILMATSSVIDFNDDDLSSFNTNDTLNIPYFSKEEVFELFEQHETESGQIFSLETKEKIAEITAGQPGLVNGFGYNLVEKFPDAPIFDYSHYLQIEEQYTSIHIDKNISNIVNKGKKYRNFLESLLFNERKIPFEIYDERIKFLNINGLITFDADKNIIFNVPLYKKCLQIAFAPPLNGESETIRMNMDMDDYFTEQGFLNLKKIIRDYQEYAKRRGFRYFIRRDSEGNILGLWEAALVHSFDTYIQSFLRVAEGKSYLEPHVALGRTDLLINVQGFEFVIEVKIFRDITQFKKGKIQLAYYLKSLGLTGGIYLIFVDVNVTNKKVKEDTELIEGVLVTTYLVPYDLEKDFGVDLKKWEESRFNRDY